ncbi:Cyclic di-GMP phosphodiesterase Gmr [Nitrincola nitratireducens]|uniref:Cyclic di-GMP phosphodiesterase Gmr n=1 Tax=Nitrincola nitratireducens TaxID=1229521 RepID=W9UQZ6_9GAMM|nr:Cyclic di-GMP phosphodiesterase Gmr [Nitrincola nitratireducens]
MLKEVAQRLQGCVRNTDICVRIGGDEFVVITTQLEQENQAVDVAEKMLRQFNTPITVGNHSFDLGISIGISLYPKHGRELGTLLEKADSAMYEIKQQGRNGYRIYSA